MRTAPDPVDVWMVVRNAASAVCPPEVPPERLQAAVTAAALRAFAPCHLRDCPACERSWADSGLPCHGRRVRMLAKQLVQAMLPLMRRGCTLRETWPVMAEAAAEVLRRKEVGGA